MSRPVSQTPRRSLLNLSGTISRASLRAFPRSKNRRSRPLRASGSKTPRCPRVRQRLPWPLPRSALGASSGKSKCPRQLQTAPRLPASSKCHGGVKQRAVRGRRWGGKSSAEEGRNPKAEIRKKSEGRSLKILQEYNPKLVGRCGRRFRISVFGLLSAFRFRISDFFHHSAFVFVHLPTTTG